MTALLCPPPTERRRVPETRKQAPAPASFGWLAWPALALLAGYLLLCHGCHGDEDNELFAHASGVSFAHDKAHGR